MKAHVLFARKKKSNSISDVNAAKKIMDITQLAP